MEACCALLLNGKDIELGPAFSSLESARPLHIASIGTWPLQLHACLATVSPRYRAYEGAAWMRVDMLGGMAGAGEEERKKTNHPTVEGDGLILRLRGLPRKLLFPKRQMLSRFLGGHKRWTKQAVRCGLLGTV